MMSHGNAPPEYGGLVRVSLAFVAASLLALGGCGASKPTGPPPPNFDPVAGPRIDGELVIQCGTDPNETELF